MVISFLQLLVIGFGILFSFAWRGALLVGALFLIDWFAPGKVSCVFREKVAYEIALSGLSSCTVLEVPYLSLISLAALLVIALALIYPIREFFNKIFAVIFWSVNIISLGYPLKLIAFLASREPSVAGRWLEKSDIFGPV